MDFRQTSIAGVIEVVQEPRRDARGRFRRMFCASEFIAVGLVNTVAQINHSVSVGRGTLRGFHLQRSPAAEDKLVTCTVGRVIDVAVDLRAGSATFRQSVAVELGDANALFIPKGCAHGFQVLSDEAHLIYLHSEYYAPEHEFGVRFDDPAIGFDWPLSPQSMSERDLAFPLIDDRFKGFEL